MTVDLVAENARLRFALNAAITRIHAAVERVTNHPDQTEPCAVLAVDVRDILEGRRDPQQAPP